jgi:ferritin-like metal-binding protein YciE
MSKMNSLNDLLVEELKDLYSAEKQITAALPKMAKKASSPELRQAFETHLQQTKEQIVRLEKVCELVGTKPTGKVCKAMQGLVEEGKEILEQDGEPTVIDAALIAAAQRVEHYEIAGYGCVRTFARILGMSEAEQLLQQTLEEEAQTDELLTQLAESTINMEAPKGGEMATSGGSKKSR